MGITVRYAELSDIAWLKTQLKLFSSFYETKYELYDEESAEEKLTLLIEGHVFLVAEKNNSEPLGFIAGYLTPHSYNSKIIVLSEVFWWVAEKDRGSRAGLMLFNQFVKLGKEHAHWVTVSLEKNSPVNPKCLTKRGFDLLERNFVMEVE